MTAPSAPLEDYFRAVEAVDAAGATELVLDLLDDGATVAGITADVLVPAQVRVGRLWEGGSWTVADEHAATAVTERALSAIELAASPRRTTGGRHVLVACAEGEWHSLPARMAAAAAGTPGLRLTVLGPSLPADHLGRRLAAGDVDLLALSCTVPSNLLGAARCVQAAHEVGVPVLVGGRAFGSSPLRAEAIGADAWAADADALREPVALRGGPPVDLPVEAVLLDAVDDGTIALADERLAAVFPALATMRPAQRERTREDLRWMARYTGAAVLTGDPCVLDDYLGWLLALLSGRVPVDVLATSAHVVADTVEPFAATGARLLREATERVLHGRLP